MSDEVNDFNQQVIDDFRANGGECGGPFAGVPMVIVHHTGAKSGIVRHAPLTYLPDGDDARHPGTGARTPLIPAPTTGPAATIRISRTRQREDPSTPR